MKNNVAYIEPCSKCIAEKDYEMKELKKEKRDNLTGYQTIKGN
jgi:hypothetical protein